MNKKPTSLKDLKKASKPAKEEPGDRLAGIHTAIGDAKGSQTKALVIGGAAIVISLMMLAVFYVFAQGMAVKIGPDEAVPTGRVTLESGLGWVSDTHEVFVMGSSYYIRVHAEDFISQTIHITPETKSSFLEVTLTPKPATLHLTTDPAQNGTRWILDGQQVAARETLEIDVPPGDHTLIADHPYFQPEEVTLKLRRAEQIHKAIPLSRILGQISIQSLPANASAVIDGQTTLSLPYSGTLESGKHTLHIQAPGYTPISDQIEITNTQKLVQRDYRMQPLQSAVRINTAPASARVTLDGRSVDNGAFTTVNANQSYTLKVSHPGYETTQRTIQVGPGKNREISIDLKAAIGTVTFVSEPMGADIYIGGQNKGKTPKSIDLQVLPTKVEFKLAGYRPATETTTPVKDKTTTLKATLQTELEARLSEMPRTLTNSAGLELVRFKPDRGAFFIGAKRGEPGQRANELYRQMQLTKYFYAGKHEVTVGQFRKFSPSFGSGQTNDMPASGVTWLEAAQFCNWLSHQENLQPFYTIRSGKVVAYDPYADGYRLPTEAEWEWLARKANRAQPTPYTWGARPALTKGSGNLADTSAKGSVPRVVTNYTDGYAKLAPVGSFPPELSGLHDMSGNVREWVNDRYALVMPGANEVAVNYFGPATGEGHTVKGSSYMSANQTALRAASRGKESISADDIGFRVARYIYGAEDK